MAAGDLNKAFIESDATRPGSRSGNRPDVLRYRSVVAISDRQGSRAAPSTQIGTRQNILCGTWEPVTPMVREDRTRSTRKRQSTEAAYRDGAARSSAEGSVTELERRGCPNRLGSGKQPQAGGLP